jgi:hypothetical protein
MKQLTRITRVRNSLAHEDRLEALAGACASFIQDMPEMSQEQIDQKVEESRRMKAHEDFMKSIKRRDGKSITMIVGEIYRPADERKTNGWTKQVWGPRINDQAPKGWGRQGW